MASFSFGAGNASKLLRLPLYLAGRVLTAVVPRSSDEWVFGCGAGIGEGALALWQEARDGGHPMLWLVGSDGQAQDAAARGIPYAGRHSLRGLWRTARARVVVITHGYGDVNRYATAGAFVVQLWHGIPLKRIGLDSPETLRSGILPDSRALRGLLRVMYRRAGRGIRLIPAASDLVRGRLESAFALPDARVSMPLHWDDVRSARPEAFTVTTVPARFAAHGDAHAGLDEAVGTLDGLLRLARELGPAEKPPRAGDGSGRRVSAMPLIEVARTRTKPEALDALEQWTNAHAEVAAVLHPADTMIDGMRGASSLWYRVRINLQHVPADQRPAQEELIADYDPWAGKVWSDPQ